MGTITTGIGLVSGINSAQLIDSLIALESRGKTLLQQRIANLTSQRTAIMDINARLLNLKNAAKAFRLDRIFQSALATSSDEDILTATAAKGAQPGVYQFIVRQLVTTSQQLSKGFSDKTTTPLGLSSLSFEFGHGALARDRSLDQLNGGTGMNRGRISITDRAGATATVDLTDVTTLNEVIQRINDTTGVKVTASVDGDHLVITDDNVAALGTLTIAEVAGHTTAADLGILGSGVAATLTGTSINTIGGDTALASLNDGNGVLTKNNVSDLLITARDGTAINVELGRVNLPITSTTALADLNNGTGVTIAAEEDPPNPDLKFIARDGSEHEVSLNGVTTVAGLMTRVSSETGGKIAISIAADGKKLVVTDTTGATTSNLYVMGAGDNATKTAEDLGILKVAGVAAATFDGVVIPNTISNPPVATIQNALDRINNADGNAGKIVASIAADGVSLLITDTTAGSGNLIIRGTAGNPYAAGALGIETATDGVAASTVDGRRLVAALGSVLVNNLNGGAGLSGNNTLAITDRSGGNAIFTLDETVSLTDLISQINSSVDVNVTVSLNSAGNGLLVTDDSGGTGNFIITGVAAAELGIDTDVAGVAAATVRGTNLQLRYVSQAAKLSELNYGRGIGLGKFRITDATGAKATVDIGSDSATLQDVIEEINSRGLAINARINDTGDGLLIESDLDVGEIAVTKISIESVSGTTAKDLNILGSSSTVEDAVIDGSYQRTVTLAESDSLQKVLEKVNAAGIPVSGSIINAGVGAAPFRLNFTSAITGSLGELLIDSGEVDLGLSSLTRGRDAKVFFGADNAEDGLLVTSSSNSVKSIINGVTLDLKSASEDPVTVTVTRDTTTIGESVKQLVTTFNDVIARIDQYDFFNVDTQERGPLLGNTTTSNVRQAMYRVLQGRALGVTTQFQYLREVGISIGSDGQIKFDQTKFDAAYANDPEAVENLFAAFKSTTAPTEEIFTGVFVQKTQATVTARGFGDQFGDLMDRLTNSIDGTVTLADRNFKSQIDTATDRITVFDARLEAKRQRLQDQFNAMEQALAKLQGQGNALNSMASNVYLAQTGGR